MKLIRPKSTQAQTKVGPELVILLFSRSDIQVAEVKKSGEQILLSEPSSYSWTASTLASVLKEIQSSYNCDKAEILLGQDLAVVKSFVFSSHDKKLTQKAESQIQALLGKRADDFGTDYQEIDLNNDQTAVQTFTVKKTFLNVLGSGLDSAGIDVESINPLGFYLVPEKTDSASLVLWGDDYLYASLVFGNVVLDAKAVEGENVYKQISTLISSLENQYSLKLERLFMASKKLNKTQLEKISKKNVDEVDLNPFAQSLQDNEEFKTNEIFLEDADQETEPIVTDSQTDDEIEKDSGIIQSKQAVAPTPPLKVTQQLNQEPVMESVSSPPNKSNAKLIAIIVTVVVVLSGMVVGGFFVYQNAMSEATTPPEVIQTPEVTPESTPDPVATESAQPEETDEEELDLSSLSVNVLNGSGTPGAAGVGSDVLSDAGFESINTGNADSYDYQETVIRVKPDQDQLYQVVLMALQGRYEVTQGDPLPANDQYDVVIIIGQN